MESEKVKEILKFCSEGNDCYDGCPYKHDTHCVMKISKQALTLINKLEKENGELKQHITKVEKGIINIARERNKKEELASKFIDSYHDSLKQFAERLKVKTRVIVDFYKDHADKSFNGISEKDIDETLKEFLK